MFDLSQIDLPAVIFIAVLLGCAIPIVVLVTDHQRKARQAELDHQLKSEMIAQGKSPEEIQAMLNMKAEAETAYWSKKSQ